MTFVLARLFLLLLQNQLLCTYFSWFIRRKSQKLRKLTNFTVKWKVTVGFSIFGALATPNEACPVGSLRLGCAPCTTTEAKCWRISGFMWNQRMMSITTSFACSTPNPQRYLPQLPCIVDNLDLCLVLSTHPFHSYCSFTRAWSQYFDHHLLHRNPLPLLPFFVVYLGSWHRSQFSCWLLPFFFKKVTWMRPWQRQCQRTTSWNSFVI